MLWASYRELAAEEGAFRREVGDGYEKKQAKAVLWGTVVTG